MILTPFIIPTVTVVRMMKTNTVLFRFLRNKVPLGNAFVRYRLPPSPRLVKVDMDLAAAALRAWYIISHGYEGDLQDYINFDNSGGRGVHTLCPFLKWYIISQKPDPEKCHAVWFSLETSTPKSAACRSNQLALHVDRFASPSEFPHISEEAKQIADLLSELQRLLVFTIQVTVTVQ